MNLDELIFADPDRSYMFIHWLNVACTWEANPQDPRLSNTLEPSAEDVADAAQEAEEIAEAELRAAEDAIGDDSLEARPWGHLC